MIIDNMHLYFTPLLDGILKMFDVYYYEEIEATDIINPSPYVAQSKEECAYHCVTNLNGCRAFDVTPSDDTYLCNFAMTGYSTIDVPNDANRSFNHFKIHTQGRRYLP